MPTPLETISTDIETDERFGLDDQDLISIYRTMYLSRSIDDREIKMKTLQKIFFQISGAGHEAINVAAGLATRSGYDWFFPYYRDRALALQLGVTPYEMLLQAVGAGDDPASGGRQMPAHFGHPDLNIPTSSSPVGSQFLPAVGCAEAIVRGQRISAAEQLGVEGDEVVLVAGGDGATSEGEFWESLNTASNEKLPVIYLVEDNGYAISVPVEVQTAGGSISKLVDDFPDLLVREVDGTDPLASYGVMREAVAHCRERKGPALVHAHVIRPYNHSMSDNEKLYKTPAEREEEAARDPIPNFGAYLVENEIATEDELEQIREEVEEEVFEASDRALEHEQPGEETVYKNVYSDDEEGDPTSDAFDTEPEFEGDETTMVDLLNRCLHDEMERDPRVVVFGEDVADASREEVLDEVEGKGGVFKVTAGLQREFGKDRSYNTPLAEANIAGRAVGMAVRGMKPVAEIQFVDYIWPAFNQIRSELATFRWRSDGHWKAPAVIRAPYGGYIKGAMYHSQSSGSLFTHTPGLRVVCPSNALDANGMLRTAIRCDDPVIFLEHKHLYRQTYNKGRYPGPDYMVPFGKADVVREGADLTVVTYGALVQRSVKAVQQLERDGQPVDAEIIDLRSLNPLDMEAVARSVKRTNKVLVAYEDPRSFGWGAEIAARISDEVFEWLDGPVRRVAATDTFVGYAPKLEDAILPQVDDIAEAMTELEAY